MDKNCHKKILRIALPSILSNITVPLLGLTDMAIAGHLGSPSYIGAIAIGGTIFSMTYWIFNFLRMGTSGMTSQAFGADDKRKMGMLLESSLYTSLTIACIILLLQVPLLRLSLWIMSPTDTVAAHTATYFYICVWGAPAVLGLYSMNGWFVGLQNAKYPLYVAVTQNIVNISATLCFVFILKMGVAGVALGTMVAQYCGLLLSFVYGHRLLRKYGIPLGGGLKKDLLHRFFTVNRDIFLRTLCLVCVTLYFTSAGSRQGDLILAANALLMQFFSLYSYFMDGFAFAGEAMSGECVGAKDYPRLRMVVRNLFIWGTGVALLFTLLYAGGGRTITRLLTNEAQVVATASVYLPWAALIPVAGLSAFVWDGIFIGLTATRHMLTSMFCATVTFFTVYTLLFPVWQNHALWLAFLLYLCMRGLVQHVLYRNKVLPLQPTDSL